MGAETRALCSAVHNARFCSPANNSEVLRLLWRNVDFKTGLVTLDPGMMKNREGRVFQMTAGLRSILEAQRRATQTTEREQGSVVPWVFHRDGNPIKKFRRSWLTARREAGYPDLLVHDFRSTAVRNLVRSGVSEQGDLPSSPWSAS